jgi:hypothetical protein
MARVKAVCALPVTVSIIGVIPHTLHVLKRLDLLGLLYVTIERSVILNTCNIESFYVTIHFSHRQYTYLPSPSLCNA